MNKIDVEGKFEEYLRRMKIRVDMMPEVQYQETKRAFMAGFGEAYLTMQHYADLPDGEAIKQFEAVLQQVADYFHREMIKDKDMNPMSAAIAIPTRVTNPKDIN